MFANTPFCTIQCYVWWTEHYKEKLKLIFPLVHVWHSDSLKIYCKLILYLSLLEHHYVFPLLLSCYSLCIFNYKAFCMLSSIHKSKSLTCSTLFTILFVESFQLLTAFYQGSYMTEINLISNRKHSLPQTPIWPI